MGHIAFAHLRTPIHNPSPFIHAVVLAHAGNTSFSVAGSWRGAGCVTFESASVREYLTSLGSIKFHDNQVTFELVKLADRASPVYEQLIEVRAKGFAHELWLDARIRWALSRLVDVYSVDQYCIDGRDFTAVRALIMVNRSILLPDSLTVHLPPTNYLKVVKITKMATVLDQMGPNSPSPFESDSDSDEIPSDRAQPFRAPAGVDEELPRGLPLSPVSYHTPPPPTASPEQSTCLTSSPLAMRLLITKGIPSSTSFSQRLRSSIAAGATSIGVLCFGRR
ncbi:hypothetical protein ZWY2020_029862 [Hordeum vulgare]|nr:hypothetical protein ZWY2020_029862 [Hordeum vulgare]